MKRLLSLLLTIGILSTVCGGTTVFAADIQYESNDVTVLSELEIVGISEAETVSRAAFVSYAAEALLPELSLTGEKLPFVDLPLDSAEYNNILDAYALGIVKGNEVMFYPNEPISEMEAITMLLRALGYERVAVDKGGYPNGYLACARAIGLLRGVSDTSASLSSARAAALIRKALEAEMLETKSYSDKGVSYKNEGDTVLYAKYGIIKETGIVNAYGKSALMREYETVDGYVNIGGTRYESRINLFPYLGYRVEYYYNEDDNVVLTAYPYKTEVTAITADQEPKLNGKTLSYLENDKKTTVNLSNNVSVVYNGKCKADYKPENFDIEKGSISLIDNGGNDTDVVIINDYTSYVVQRVDSKELLLIEKTERDRKLDISNDCSMDVKTEDGAAVSVKDIRENDVLTICISEDEKVVYGYLTRKTVQGEITAKTELDSEVWVEISGGQYRVDNALLDKKELSVRGMGKYYLDHYGFIVWYDSRTMAEDLAVVVKSGFKKTSFVGKVQVKLFCGDGVMREVETADKFTLDGVKYDSVSALPAALTPGNLIRYTLDENEKLKWIDSEVMSAKENSSSLTLMAPEENSYYLEGSFQGRYVPTDLTTIFKLPNLDRSDINDSDFKVGTRGNVGLNGDDTYVVKGYTYDGKFGVPDVMVIRDAAASGNVSWNSPYNLVKDIKQMYDSNTGENRWIITLVMSQDEEDCYIEESLLTKNGYGTNEDYSLSVGDIVQLRKSSAGSYKEVIAMEVAWDCEKKTLNPSSRLYTSGGYTGFYSERELQYGQAYWIGNEVIGMTRTNGITPGVPGNEATSADIYYFKAYKNNIWVVDSQFKNDRKRYIRRGDFSDIKDYQHYSNNSGLIYYAMRGSLMFLVVYQ